MVNNFNADLGKFVIVHGRLKANDVINLLTGCALRAHLELLQQRRYSRRTLLMRHDWLGQKPQHQHSIYWRTRDCPKLEC